MQEYVYKVMAEKYLKVRAECEEDAYELVKENYLLECDDSDIVDVTLIDSYDVNDIDEDYYEPWSNYDKEDI